MVQVRANSDLSAMMEQAEAHLEAEDTQDSDEEDCNVVADEVASDSVLRQQFRERRTQVVEYLWQNRNQFQ